MADLLVEGIVEANSAKNTSVKVNDKWYRFNKALWQEHGASFQAGTNVRFNVGSSVSEYQGKMSETLWVNEPIGVDEDIPEAVENNPDYGEVSELAASKVVVPKSTLTITSSPAVSKYNNYDLQRDIQFVTQVAAKCLSANFKNFHTLEQDEQTDKIADTSMAIMDAQKMVLKMIEDQG